MYLDLVRLDSAAVAAPFRAMTYPNYRRLLSFRPGDQPPVAIAALASGVPVGLALATLGPPPREAKLCSVFVVENWRRRGLATALARDMEAACAELGVEQLNATYMSGQPATPAVERVLARTGWEPPERRMLVVRVSLDSLRGAPWLEPRPLPPDCDVVPWVDLTPIERDEIRDSQLRAPWIAEDLYPFDFEVDLEPITSLALRVNGQVLGWCLNHIIDGTLRYTCSFTRRDQQARARILPVYVEVVKRMPAAGMTCGMWTVPVHHESMVRFAEKHMRPYSTFFGETFGVKRLIHQSHS